MIAFFAYLVTGLAVFWKLFFTFFQQDEWAIFGNFLYWQKAHLNWITRLFFYEQDTHIIPFSNFFSYLQFYFFRLDFPFYAAAAILIHACNAFLVYKVAREITAKNKLAFFAGLIFLINSIPSQAITWIATTIGTATSTTFVMLSILFFIKGLRNKINHKFLMISCLFLFISLLFKETSIFTFLSLPALWVLYADKRDVKEFLRTFFPLLILGFVYVLFRLFFALFGYHSTSESSLVSQPSIFVYAYRIFANPLKFVSQSIIPPSFIIILSSTIIKLGYPQLLQGGIADPHLVESIGADIVSFGTALLVIMLCFLLTKKDKFKKNDSTKLIWISVIFIFLSALPFIFIPGPAGYFSLVDGRHLYITNAFTSILLSSLGWMFYSLYDNKFIRKAIIFVLIIFLGFNILQIRKDLNTQMGYAYLRKSILNQIIKEYPKLPERVVFYTESDKAYYGLPPTEYILPFQSGFGQTLLVWYNMHGDNLPSCFFKSKYLYVLLEQDYKECEGRGFGYYRKLDSLKAAIGANQLKAGNVIAYRFYSQNNKLENITLAIRKEIQK